jgi:YHS domain-containing protein
VVRILLLGILLAMIARAFWRVVDGIVEGIAPRRERHRRMPSGMKLVRDPVCGTYVVPNSTLSLTSRAGTYYFCSETCRAKYQGRT